jgi:hypothetical protein
MAKKDTIFLREVFFRARKKSAKIQKIKSRQKLKTSESKILNLKSNAIILNAMAF